MNLVDLRTEEQIQLEAKEAFLKMVERTPPQKQEEVYQRFLPFLGYNQNTFSPTFQDAGAFDVGQFLYKPLSDTLFDACRSRLKVRNLYIITKKQYNEEPDKLLWLPPLTLVIVINECNNVVNFIYKEYYH